MFANWQRALDDYLYPVNLACYRNANLFPGFCEMNINGDRPSTVDFEKHFKDNAPSHIEAYLE
jgi:hypothetical protein